MRFLSYISLLTLLLMNSSLFSQTQMIAIDHHGNTYLTENNILIKINSDSTDTTKFDFPASNYISSIDVSNPMRILIFSKDFNSVLFLDNLLSPLGSVFSMDDQGIYNTPVACYAAKGGFWIYDGAENKIKHINNQGHTDIESGQLPVFSEEPVFIKESKGMIYLGFKQEGILTFNTYAAYIKTLPLKHDIQPVITSEFIYFCYENMIFRYDRLDFDTNLIHTCGTKPHTLILQEGNLIINCGTDEIIITLQ